jgi:hypothetical protein
MSEATHLLWLAAWLRAGNLHAAADALSSWNDGPAKQAILKFV